MKESAIRNKSFAFAVKVVQLYKFLSIEKKEYVLSKQLLRSGTAIGALVKEAEHAESTADFIHKFSIALKEANESEYWLEILLHGNYIDQFEFDSYSEDIREILRILIAIIKTTKAKNK